MERDEVGARFPLLLAELGFLPAGAARDAAAGEDPVGRALECLAARGKIEEALDTLLSKEHPDELALVIPVWCERARQFLATTVADSRGRRSAFGLTTAACGPATEKGARPAATPSLRAGRSLESLPDRYEVRGVLGRGGMGTVYEVNDRLLGRTVALKILERGTPHQKLRFLAEARATAHLGHPNILPCYTARTDLEGRPYYTMMRVEGTTLESALRLLPLEPALRALAHAARAVAHAHRQKMIHRDLKPANVMLGEHGEVWVVDWGLVRLGPLDEREEGGAAPAGAADARLTATGDFLGTPAYLSPEQARSDPALIGPHTDIYGLGGVLYEILTGTPPNTQKSLALILDALAKGALEPPSSRAAEGEVPPALEAICLKAMAPRPANRYASADDLAGDIEAFLARQPVSAYRAPIPVRAAAWVRSHVALFAIGAVLSLAVAATIGIVYGRNSLEARATQAREGEEKRATERRLADARSGRDRALEAAKIAHEQRLGALRDYSEPFEHVFVYPPPPEEPIEKKRELLGKLAKITHNPSADFWVAKASEDWQAAAAQARSSLLTLGERNDSLDAQELEWALELALATERALITSAWIEKLRQTATLDPEAGPRFYRQVMQLLAALQKPDRLGPDHPMVLRARELLKGWGKLEIGPLPDGTTGKLIEFDTTQKPVFGRIVVKESVSPGGESIELPLGSYSLEVARGDARFFFPVLVERGRTSRIDVELPTRVPEGFVWIPPGPFLEGGDAPGAWPRHRCFLAKGFFLARTEVTFARYIEFLRALPNEATRDALAPTVLEGYENQPVLGADFSFINPYDRLEHPIYGVSRFDAKDYASWLSQNDPDFDYRLPSEEEWARAAAGADGRAFVWGDRFDASLAIVQGNGKHDYWGPAGTFSADSSPFGSLDMAGNLSEWTASDLPGERAVLRGGSWGDAESVVRLSGRLVLHASSLKGGPSIGFRVAALPKGGG
ncbi:MAG: SUMF1/EgtB/PvdO family nonheme iron enzyme [Planctomycetes bacterium]|nr:SUMF1/EgtB/PvdO family nonheme iron enzyme [Planctomycetota bacterium]